MISNHTMMLDEALQDKLNQKENDLLLRFKENIECLDASNRVENLMNEQQYLYLYNKYFHLGKLIKQENIYFNDRNDILKNFL